MKRKDSHSGRGSKLLVAGTALAAVLAAPTAGSAASLSNSQFHIKAENSAESKDFWAIRPFFGGSGGSDSGSNPTPGGSTDPTTSPGGSSGTTPAGGGNPVTGNPAPTTPTMIYFNDGISAYGKGAIGVKVGQNGGWGFARTANQVPYQPDELAASNQTAYSVTTVGERYRSIRLVVPDLEPGTYTYSFWGKGTNDTVWTMSTAGAEAQATAKTAANSWRKISYSFTVETKSTKEIVAVAYMPGIANYGDTLYWDDVLLEKLP